MAEDDYVLITIAKDGTNYKVQTVAEAITVVGKATSKNSSKNTITVDGTAYEKDKNSAVDVGTFGLSPQYDATLYLDSYGYMLYAEAGAADTSGDKAIVVLDAYQSLDADGKLVHMAKGMLSSGEIVAWQVASTAESLKNNVCTYAEDDGVYTLTRTTNLDKKPGTDHANKTDSDGEYAPVYTAAYTTEIQKTTRGLAIGSSGTVTAYLNADTNYIFYNAGEATVLTGAQTGTPTHVTYEKKGDTWYVTAVFINDEAPVSTSDSSDIIYVVKGVTDTYSIIPEGKDKAEEFKGYDAYLNGEKIDGFYSKESVDNSAFYKVSKDDASGAYILKDSNKHTASTGETAVATAAKVTAISADAGVLKTTVEYDISKAVIVDTTGNDINSASDITESHYVAVMFDAETNVASYVYVVADPAG